MAENIHRLEGTVTQGGLIIRKKKNDDSVDKFAMPKTSALGLDKLAAKKEKEKKELAEKLEEKKRVLEETVEKVEETNREFKRLKSKHEHRRYGLYY